MFLFFLVAVGLTFVIAVLMKLDGGRSARPAAQRGSQRSAPQQADVLRKELAYLRTDLKEIAWVEFDRNDVYIGFSTVPSDSAFLVVVNAAAVNGNRALGLAFTCGPLMLSGAGGGRGPGPSIARQPRVTARSRTHHVAYLAGRNHRRTSMCASGSEGLGIPLPSESTERGPLHQAWRHHPFPDYQTTTQTPCGSGGEQIAYAHDADAGDVVWAGLGADVEVPCHRGSTV